MLQVIGAGLGRTGTHSLGMALELLGIGPCYNISEVKKNRDHPRLWEEATDGKAIDWESLFAAYQSAVEWPAVAFLPQLYEQFPQAQFILTLREPDSWYESALNTVFQSLELSASNPDREKSARNAWKRRMILDHMFGGNYRDKEAALSVYNQHIQDVAAMIPPDQLLQFDVSEGWGPLCAFLDVSVPETPFPWLNQREAFLASAPEWAQQIKQSRTRFES